MYVGACLHRRVAGLKVGVSVCGCVRLLGAWVCWVCGCGGATSRGRMGGAAVYDYAQIDLGVPSKVALLICGTVLVIMCHFDA